MKEPPIYDAYPTYEERLVIPHAPRFVPDEMKGNLAALRKAKGLTQAGLAKEAGIPLRAIQKYEGGECALKNITLEKAVRLADALDIEPRDLLAAEDKEMEA